MSIEILVGLMIPFAGTALGAMMVLFMKNEINNNLQKVLTGFAGMMLLDVVFG